MKNPNADEDLDEEDYEENAVVQGETVCRVLILVLLDNTSFPTIIDENLDCLAQFRKISNQTCSLLVNGEYKFSYLFNEKLEVFSTDSESLPIKNLIETYHIKHLVVDEKIKFHLFQEDLKVSEQVPDPDELFREPIKIKYLASQTHIDKIIVGKVFPKPELLIVSHSGDEESSFKYKDFLFSEVNENAVNFVSKSG